MRNIFIACLVILLLLCLGGCSKDDNSPTAPVDLLPPATQVGVNKVGCLVNGEVLLPKGGGLSGNKNCFYQFVDGGYYFGLSLTNYNVNNDTRFVSLFTRNQEIKEGRTYIL